MGTVNHKSPDSKALQELHGLVMSLEGVNENARLGMGMSLAAFYGYEKAVTGDPKLAKSRAMKKFLVILESS